MLPNNVTDTLIYIAHQIKKKFNICIELAAKQSESDFDGLERKLLLTQSYDELKKYLISHGLECSGSITEFEPESKWAFVHRYKAKFKWYENPVQTIYGGKIYSIFSSDNFKTSRSENNDYLFVLKMRNPLTALCIYLPNKIEDRKLKVHEIKEKFTSSIECKRLFIAHDTTKQVCNLKFPELELAGHKLELIYGIDYYHLNFDRHGLYLNHLSRNKREHIDATPNADDFMIDDIFLRCNIWVENLKTNKVLFNYFT